VPQSAAHPLTTPSGKLGGVSALSQPWYPVVLFCPEWCVGGSEPRCATSMGGTGAKLCMQLCQAGGDQCGVGHRPGVQVKVPAGSVVLVLKGSESKPSAISSRFISPQTLEDGAVNIGDLEVVGGRMTLHEFEEWCDSIALDGPTEDDKIGALRVHLKTPAKPGLLKTEGGDPSTVEGLCVTTTSECGQLGCQCRTRAQYQKEVSRWDSVHTVMGDRRAL